MGTTFLFNTKRALPGMTVQLKHRGLWLSKSSSKELMGQITRAKAMLSTTMAAIQWPGTNERQQAAKYFVTAATGPKADQWAIIKSKLQLTYGGLSTDVTFKMGVHGQNAYGYVGVDKVAAGTANSFVDSDGDNITFGDHAVHLSKKKMLKDKEIGVITVIHECTHKFANTDDYGDSGYRHNDDSGWWEPGMTTQQALNNADSYAWFVYQVAKAKGI